MFFLWNPESRKISLLESEMLGFGIRNTGQGVRSPSNDWNPESKTGIKYLKSGIHGVEARIQDCLAWINRVEIRLLDSLNSIRVLQCMYCLLTTYFLDTNSCIKTFHMNITLCIKVYTCMSVTRIHQESLFTFKTTFSIAFIKMKSILCNE